MEVGKRNYKIIRATFSRTKATYHIFGKVSRVSSRYAMRGPLEMEVPYFERILELVSLPQHSNFQQYSRYPGTITLSRPNGSISIGYGSLEELWERILSLNLIVCFNL